MSDAETVLMISAQTGDESGTIIISTSPFTVGRATGKDLQINARDVSSKHAAFRRNHEGDWELEDLGSTNGTFVNGQRISAPRKLVSGDVIHFAGQAFKVMDDSPPEGGGNQTVFMTDTNQIKGNLELVQIIEKNQVYSHFQPIFDAQTQQPVAWEALGRGVVGGERMPPGKMFGLADRFNLNYQLSQRLRQAAVSCVRCGHCWRAAPRIEIWINLHPSEVTHPDFEDDMMRLASMSSDASFAAVIEAPETWVSQTDEMQSLVARVRETGMRVAYDDFGAGQSRIQDLMSVPPDYLKFDRALITNVREDRVKRDILQAMVSACDQLDVTTLAEGVETVEEYDVCMELGIKLIQGFHLERPKPAFELFAKNTVNLPTECQHVRLNTV